jgi:hypothetical protein
MFLCWLIGNPIRSSHPCIFRMFFLLPLTHFIFCHSVWLLEWYLCSSCFSDFSSGTHRLGAYVNSFSLFLLKFEEMERREHEMAMLGLMHFTENKGGVACIRADAQLTCDFVIGCMRPWAPSCLQVPITPSQRDLCFKILILFFRDLIHFCFGSFDVSIFRSGNLV